eukprot:673228-Ditylum_brightwellii.AAC.1
MSIANIGLANHATEFDPAIQPFLLDILQYVGTMQQVQTDIKEHDDVRKEAIKFIERVREHGHDDHISNDKEGNQEEHNNNNITCM